MFYNEVYKKLKRINEVFESNNPPNSNLILNKIDKNYILSNYPEFYQLFLKEIGTVYLSHCDQFIFEVTLPKRTQEAWFLEDDFDHSQGHSIIFQTDDKEVTYLMLDSEHNISNYSSFNKSIDVKKFSAILCDILNNVLDNYITK